MLANNMLTKVRQRLTQETKGRRGISLDPVWANRRLLLKGAERLSDRGWNRLKIVFAVDDRTGRLEAVWKVKEQLRALLRTGYLADAAAARTELEQLVSLAGQSETGRLYRTARRW